MSDGICETCKYLRASECRKNPPITVAIHPTKMDVMTSDIPQYTRHRAAWPTVAMHNWCGEYEKRQKSPATVVAETALVDASLGLLEEVYVGEGQIVCPPALQPHIRKIVDALKPLSEKDLPVHCVDCHLTGGAHMEWCRAREIE